MKLPLLLLVALVLSACTGEGPAAPTVLPSRSPIEANPSPPQATPIPESALALAMAVLPAPVGQPTTFSAGASSIADATLDFGDGSQATFKLAPGTPTTLKHIYAEAGTFLATLTATTATSAASMHVQVIVR
jgi:hypothetical protein